MMTMFETFFQYNNKVERMSPKGKRKRHRDGLSGALVAATAVLFVSISRTPPTSSGSSSSQVLFVQGFQQQLPHQPALSQRAGRSGLDLQRDPPVVDPYSKPKWSITTSTASAFKNTAITRGVTTTTTTTTALQAAGTPLAPAVAGNAYMVLLALQFAGQPIVTRAFASKSIVKGTYVFLLDLVRAVLCLSGLLLTNSWSSATVGWSWREAAMAAGLPSILYVAQNYFSLQAYQNLSPITFNVLNQTKTLSAALWCFVLLGQTLELHQIGALGVLLVAALVMEKIIPLPQLRKKKGKTSPTNGEDDDELSQSLTSAIVHDPWLAGVLPVLLASLLSGLAGALAQRALQHHARNSLLFSLELAACSCVTSTFTLGLLPTPDHRRLVRDGWWQGWTALTWVPLLLQASGGILVGMVTKYAGSVRKGFCLINGMFLSGLLQNWLDKDGSNHVRTEQWVGGLLAALSFWMYVQ